MNPIELEWLHLKKDELRGQIFDDELDLAYAADFSREVLKPRKSVDFFTS